MGNSLNFARAPPLPSVVQVVPVVPVEMDKEQQIVPPSKSEYKNTVRNILINQATCYKCNTLLKNEGVCKCGNVEIYGGTSELGRRVKNASFYSDCSLLEYNVAQL